MEATESPWAQLQRLRTEGANLATIVAALEQRGLSSEELELLLKDEPGFTARGAPKRLPPVTPPSTTGASLGRWVAMWALGFAATIAWCIGLGSGNSAMAILVVGMWTVGALLLALEIRSVGLGRSSNNVAYLAFLTMAVPALSGFVVGWSPVSALAAAAVVGASLLLWWARRRSEPFAALDRYDGDVFEDNDVQFKVATPEEATVAAGQVFPVVIRAQNCVDVDRELVIALGGDVRSLLGVREHTVRLPPAALVEIRLPLRLSRDADDRVRIVLGISGRGSTGGRRVRVTPAAKWVLPVDAVLANVVGALTLTTLGFGSFRLGSNGVVMLARDSSRPFIEETARLSVEQLTHPNAAEIKAAYRR